MISNYLLILFEKFVPKAQDVTIVCKVVIYSID